MVFQLLQLNDEKPASNLYTVIMKKYKQKPVTRKKRKVLLIVLAVAAALIAVGGVYLRQRWYGGKTAQDIPAEYNAAAAENASLEKPRAVSSTDPANMGFSAKLMVDGSEVPAYTREQAVSFPDGDSYTGMEGIVTFRGNNYRDSASFGTPAVTERKLSDTFWTAETGSLPKGDLTQSKGSDEWSGSGWTGQPLIVKWDEQTKQVMNLYPEKKQKESLVEVIYATMDGNVYFLDLADGTPTRDKLSIGLPFKGAGALDPRGYPILYVGAGDSLPSSAGEAGQARVFIYSLIDFTKLYEFGANDPFSPREFHAFDSSALVDEQTDTLFYPGENAVLYTMKLNTRYDPQTGALSIAPSDEAKWTYSTNRTSEEAYWWGMEDSASIWKNYMYVCDNAGDMMCIDLNTMQLVWAQDILDDANASPIFEEDAQGNRFLYVAPSLHWQQDAKTHTGRVFIYKLNAMTGEVIWKKPYEVHTEEGISGGVQATAVLGRGEIADLLIVPVARTPYKRTGRLVALDRATGEERWAFEMDTYAWSSPVAVYAEDGSAYIVQCDGSGGNVHLLDAKDGTLLDTLHVGDTNIEASPAVFGNTIVVGTRGKEIVGITIS
ncbi:MAG TPA: pyrrolo-quinoline quinone [Clostridiales bacterium]|nr:pyrrolo-quinoline quinone [Clostridiales bacterium]